MFVAISVRQQHAFCAGIPDVQSQLYSILLQIRVWLGRIWQGWTRNLSLIPFPRLLCVSDKTTWSINWYFYYIQSCIVAVLVETATKLHTQFCYKIGVGLVDYDKV